MRKVLFYVKVLLRYVITFILISIEQVLFVICMALIYLILNAEIDAPIVSDIKIGKRVKISENYYIF